MPPRPRPFAARSRRCPCRRTCWTRRAGDLDAVALEVEFHGREQAGEPIADGAQHVSDLGQETRAAAAAAAHHNGVSAVIVDVDAEGGSCLSKVGYYAPNHPQAVLLVPLYLC